MPRLSHPPDTIAAVHVHAKTGISYGVFACYALLFAYIGQWMFATIGEPFKIATEQNERIVATNMLVTGADERNLLQLQTGLTRAAELSSFNDTLFEDSKSLHRGLRKRMDQLAAAVSVAEVEPLSKALEFAIELHSDGRPFVDRYHLRTAAKKLQDVARKDGDGGGGGGGGGGASASALEKLFGSVKSAIELSRGSEDGPPAELLDEDEKKLPSPYMPSFWACLAFMVTVLLTVITNMATKWSVAFEALMYYHSTSKLVPSETYVRVTPPPHRGAAEIVPLQQSSNGKKLFFMHQRQKYEVTAGGEEADGRAVVGTCRPLLCPIALPLEQYAKSGGLSGRAVAEASEEFGENSFAIPMPTWVALYKEQLQSPIAVFQLCCSILWMLDEYWKYTLFTLFMILAFEATTAFQRLKNLQQLRGMSAKATAVYAYRNGSWQSISSTEILPSDLISLNRVPGHEPTTVPADCVLLRGGAVVNESTLTGESVPQLKDPLTVDGGSRETPLDIKSSHRVHTLYSGTLLMQSTTTSAAEADEAAASASDSVAGGRLPNCAGVPRPPDGGCVCYVLATAFSSSQGELMRMIEFSTAKVTADKKETLGLLMVLLFFALSSAGYVLHVGLQEGKKTQYELCLKAVLIITSVVPPELPMQAALAVNTALMALLKAQVFCTEPFRVPYAGRLQATLFDKTGTITTDELTTRGCVNAAAAPSSTSSSSSSAAAAAAAASAVQISPISTASAEMCAIVGGCHALLQVDGKLMGDPIELAAIQSLGWTYDAPTATACATDRTPKLDAAVKAAEANLDKVRKRAQAAQAGAAQPGGEPPPTPLDMKRASEGVEEAKRARERGLARAKSALFRGVSVKIAHRHHFSSALGRMSVIATVRGLPDGGGSGGACVMSLVKGSPEAVGPLLRKGGGAGGKPAWFEATYTRLAEQGLRVLALAYKKHDQGGHADLGALCKQPREAIESDLTFCGFLAFGCAVRKDSASVIRSLRESNHTTIMLTGDAPLTALHVAKQVGMTGTVEAPGAGKKPPLILGPVPDGSGFHFTPALSVDAGFAVSSPAFSASGVRKLRAEGHDLLVTGKVLSELAESDASVWSVADLFTVYARMSPEGKERVVRALRERGIGTLMCGDGGNDVGALKAADVGVSLLCGFGNANAGGDGEEVGSNKAAGGSAAAAGGDGKEGGGSAESELAKITASQQAKQGELIRRQQQEMALKRAELGAKQKERMEAEVRRRIEAGEGALAAQWGAMKTVAAQAKAEMAAFNHEMAQKYGTGLAGQASFLADSMMGDMGDEEGGMAPPMVKLGDASIAAPFTSKLPSIRSCVDIVRQGHCTLVSTVQQQQILMLHCLISAYSLSALSLDGSRASEPQLIASGMLLSVASIAFSFARPLDRLSPTLPLQSIFHPALMLSVLGQLATHATCMYLSIQMAKAHMSDKELQEAIKWQKEQEKLEELGDAAGDGKSTAELLESGGLAALFSSSNHKPNLLNTIVFLVETAQQVAVMLVNYKGRPWMKGATENPALLYSLVACAAGVTVAAWEVIPQLNSLLGLVPLPTDEMRYHLLAILAVTLLGSLLWDRLCVAVFAPRIFRSQIKELLSIRVSDFWGADSPKKLAQVALAGAWLYYTEGNLIIAGGAYWVYKSYKKREAEYLARQGPGGNGAAQPPGQPQQQIRR